MSKDNNLLDQFSLSDLPSVPRNHAHFDVSMHIDANGILSVSASHQGSDNWKRITVKSGNGRISQEEMACIVMDAEMYRKQDEEAIKKVEAKQDLEDDTYNLRDALNQDSSLKLALGDAKSQGILQVVKDMLKWLQAQDVADVAEYAARKQTLVKKLDNALPAHMSGCTGFGIGSEQEKLRALLRAMQGTSL